MRGSSGFSTSTPRVRIGARSGRYRYSLPASVSVPAPAGSDLSYAHCAAPASIASAWEPPATTCSRSCASATSTATLAWNVLAMLRVAASTTSPVSSRLDMSRANS